MPARCRAVVAPRFGPEPGARHACIPFAPFDAAEYAARLARTRAAMAARGVELLIVTDPANMNWLTGYDGWSFYVHQCVLLGLEGASRCGSAAARIPTAPGSPPGWRATT